MATLKSLPLFFLVITLLLVGQTLARESRFFSKVTRESTETTKPTTVVAEAKEQEEQPAFLPQTSENAPYGLYSRQTDLDFSPSATTTKKYDQPQYQPQKEVPAFDNNKNSKYLGNMETFETKEGATPATTEPEFYNSGDRKNYATELQGLDGYSKGDAYGGNGYYYKNKVKNGGSSYYTGEKQGMSDTRFVEKGRYFYDVNNEKPATYNYGAGTYETRGERAPEYYNNDGYYSGSTEGFKNKYYNYKSLRPSFVGGQQSLQEEEDFDFDP